MAHPIPRAGDVLTNLAILIVRIGTGVAIGCLLLRRGRHSGAPWLWAALAFDITMTMVERLDSEITPRPACSFPATTSSMSLPACFGCTLAWLLVRERSSSSSDRPQLS
jgi:hypothetical protein